MMNTDKHITSIYEYTKILEMVKAYNKKNCKHNIFYRLGILKNKKQLHVKTGCIDSKRKLVTFKIDVLYRQKLAGLT